MKQEQKLEKNFPKDTFILIHGIDSCENFELNILPYLDFENDILNVRYFSFKITKHYYNRYNVYTRIL